MSGRGIELVTFVTSAADVRVLTPDVPKRLLGRSFSLVSFELAKADGLRPDGMLNSRVALPNSALGHYARRCYSFSEVPRAGANQKCVTLGISDVCDIAERIEEIMVHATIIDRRSTFSASLIPVDETGVTDAPLRSRLLTMLGEGSRERFDRRSWSPPPFDDSPESRLFYAVYGGVQDQISGLVIEEVLRARTVVATIWHDDEMRHARLMSEVAPVIRQNLRELIREGVSVQVRVDDSRRNPVNVIKLNDDRDLAARIAAKMKAQYE